MIVAHIKKVPKSIVLVIAVSIFSKILYFVHEPVSFSYDEMVVWEISRLDLQDLIHTVYAEPHPIGFYVFLKLLPADPVFSRVAITIASYFLIFLSVLLAQKEGLFKKLPLKNGVLVYLASFSFLTITIDLKQDSLSFPLILTAVVIAAKKDRSYKKILLLQIILSTLLFIGYINYAWAISSVILIFMYQRKAKSIPLIAAPQIILVTIYYKLFLESQIAFNLNRFEWTNRYSNMPFQSLIIHLFGTLGFAETVASLFIVGALVFQLKSLWQNSRLFVLWTIFILLIPAIAEWYVRPRYVAFPLFVATLCAGATLQKVLNKKWSAVLIVALMSWTLPNYMASKHNTTTIYRQIAEHVSTNSNNFSAVSSNSNDALLVVLPHWQTPNLDTLFINSDTYMLHGNKTISRNDLLFLHNKPQLSKLAHSLEEKRIRRIVYIHWTFPKQKDDELLAFYESQCVQKSTNHINRTLDLYVYDDCVWKRNEEI